MDQHHRHTAAPVTVTVQADDPLVVNGFREVGQRVRVCSRCWQMLAVTSHRTTARTSFLHVQDVTASVLPRPDVKLTH